MKKTILASMLIAAMAFSFPLSGFADGRGGQCPLKKDGSSCSKCAGSKCSKEKGGCPIAAKMMKKAHFFLENQKEIGLKEDQVKAIKAIKIEAKKTGIRQGAEMQIFQIDLYTKLSETQIDVESINDMIDEMSANMASAGKAAVASYVKLKAVLSADQLAKAKEIWLRQEVSGHAGR